MSSCTEGDVAGRDGGHRSRPSVAGNPAARHTGLPMGVLALKQYKCLFFQSFCIIDIMSKRSSALNLMPSAVLVHLRELGENLAIARKRRREPLKAWAERVGVSEPTLARMEKGDPSVSMGVYATAVWLMGRAPALPDLAAPEHDQGALEEAVRVAKARSVRKRPSPYAAAQAPNPEPGGTGAGSVA
jgi:hypothetical protein